MPVVNYVIYYCSFSRTAPGVTLHKSNSGGKHYYSYYSGQGDRWKFEKAN